MSRNSKGFVQVLVVVLLLVLVGGPIYYFGFQKGKISFSSIFSLGSVSTRTNSNSAPIDLTSNWKTYVSNDLGISLKYPSNFKITGDYTRPGIFDFGIMRIGFVQNTGKVTDRTMFITNSEKGSFVSRAGFESAYGIPVGNIYTNVDRNELGEVSQTQYKRLEDKTFNGRIWRVFREIKPKDATYPEPLIFLLTQNSGKYYLVGMYYSNPEGLKPGDPEDGIDYLAAFDQIVSSIQFLN